MNNFFTAALLGTVQGLAEFLPISSSGHLVIAQSLIPGFSQPPVVFDAALHMGTLLAILVYFWEKIRRVNTNYIKLLIVGTIPAVIVGLVINSFADELFSSLIVVGTALIATGVLNFVVANSKPSNQALTTQKSFFVGFFQALAIIPGLSRSGSTIFAGVYKGLKKEEAAQFSFLLSVPAVLGANLLQIISVDNYQIDIAFFATGFIFAFLTGVLAIKIVFAALTHRYYKLFSFYCLGLGAIILATQLI